MALAAWALHGPLVQSPRAASRPGLAPAASRPGLAPELHEVAERLTTYWYATARSARRQFAGVLATACVSTAEFAAPDAATALYYRWGSTKIPGVKRWGYARSTGGAGCT